MANVDKALAILKGPDASPQDKYAALIAIGWSPAAASKASNYTPNQPAIPSAADTAAKATVPAVQAAGQAAKAAAVPAPAAAPSVSPIIVNTAPVATDPMAGFKKFVVENNPGTTMESLAGMDEATLKSKYRKGWAAYSGQPAIAPAAAPAVTAPIVDDTTRFTALNKKVQSGVPLTADEQVELKNLLAKSATVPLGAEAPKTEAQLKAEIEAIKVKAAAEETKEQRYAAAKSAGKLGAPAHVQAIIAAGVPEVKPEFMQTNPELLKILEDLNKTAAPGTLAPAVVTPKAPAVVTPKATAVAKAAITEAGKNVTPVQAEAAKQAAEADPNFINKVETLSKNWGLTILEAIQAGMLGYIGGATGNWQKTAQQLRLEKEEREKTAAEAEAARKAEASAQEQRWITELTAQQEEAAKNRALQRELAQTRYVAAKNAGLTDEQAALAALAGE